MIQVLINNQYGGFGVSEAAAYRLRELGVTVFDEMGEAMADGPCTLAVVEVEGPRYRVTEYDGWEAVQTPGDIEWVSVA